MPTGHAGPGETGQAIRYGGQPGLDAILVSWDAALLAGLGPGTDADEPAGRTHWQLAGEDEDAFITEVSQLVVDRQRHRNGAPATDLLRHQLAVLLLRLDLLPAGGDNRPPAGENAMFRKLRREVERSYRRTRRVEDYADRLGCSVRTLTRASLAATGRSAKQVIDDRVALQAMRLLATTNGSVAEIGRTARVPGADQLRPVLPAGGRADAGLVPDRPRPPVPHPAAGTTATHARRTAGATERSGSGRRIRRPGWRVDLAHRHRKGVPTTTGGGRGGGRRGE